MVGALGVVKLFPNLPNQWGFPSTSLPTKILTKLNLPSDTKNQLFEVNRDIKGWELETDLSQYKETDLSQYKDIDLALSWYETEVKKGMH